MRYALFQRSLDELDVEAVGDALDEAVPWLARADARMLVRRAYGVLVEGLVEVHARELAQALSRRGVSVERVEQDWLELPPLMACRRADLEPGALRVYDLYGRVTEVPWTRVLLVALGSYPVAERVQQARKPFEPAQPPGRAFYMGGLRGLMPDTSGAGQSSYEYVDRAQVMLDIVTDAPARYRIQRQRFDYSYLGARREASAAANFPLLVRDVLERAQGAIQNRGARQMRSDADEVMSYPGPNQFERESAWSLWRYLGPGAGLDAGDPYRSTSAMHVRLTAPLARAGSSAAGAAGAKGAKAAGAAGAAGAGSAGARGQRSAKRPARAIAPTSAGQASADVDDAHLDQPSDSRALATRDRDTRVRAPGERPHVADVSVAVLAGVAVAAAGWLVEPWTMLLALPVIRVVYQRMLRRRVQRHYGAAPADDDAPADNDGPGDERS